MAIDEWPNSHYAKTLYYLRVLENLGSILLPLPFIFSLRPQFFFRSSIQLGGWLDHCSISTCFLPPPPPKKKRRKKQPLHPILRLVRSPLDLYLFFPQKTDATQVIFLKTGLILILISCGWRWMLADVNKCRVGVKEPIVSRGWRIVFDFLFFFQMKVTVLSKTPVF